MDELKVLNKIADIFEDETKTKSDSMYYIEAVYREFISDIEKTASLRRLFLNFEMLPDTDIENALSNKHNYIFKLRIYILAKVGEGFSLQTGRLFKSKKSILNIKKDVVAILDSNVQVAGYWTQLTIDGGGDVTLEGNDNFKGKYIDVNIQVRNQS